MYSAFSINFPTGKFRRSKMTVHQFRNFTHLTIPAEIWLRHDISLQSKCLWAELRSLHDPSQDGCYASDDYLCDFLQLKRRRLYDLYKELKEAGLVETVSFDGRTRKLKITLEEEAI